MLPVLQPTNCLQISIPSQQPDPPKHSTPKYKLTEVETADQSDGVGKEIAVQRAADVFGKSKQMELVTLELLLVLLIMVSSTNKLIVSDQLLINRKAK
ncbi:hypothetical protein niasHT_008688 [Heterodera trifolii]|uniref:Uncharacterized protein n=1 Tax=Heterodera trifolii TaxID=157864 RepID=A0ABD2LT99_9BILA